MLRKVKSHQDIASMGPGPAKEAAVGNHWADIAAVRARTIDHDQIDAFFHKAKQWHMDQFLQPKLFSNI